ncbi:hypothetical protein KP509_08G004900 [Ceratopteris richardii]|uniref:Uncharacterized protein n=1 Tax=Ceratopteris richardii TaxID=49495 RepID=A0A8T2U4A1_CERRI|nr:hypothetical protein KP509_08G004900 [Ceratopteris richardii]
MKLAFKHDERPSDSYKKKLEAGVIRAESSTVCTPVKVSFGRHTQPETSASKQATLLAQDHTRQISVDVNTKEYKDSLTKRNPLSSIDANNNNVNVFSPSPLQKLTLSPALSGKARRIYMIPSELLSTPARRVPVKQKHNQTANTVKQSIYFTPRRHPSGTPYSSNANQRSEISCSKGQQYPCDTYEKISDKFDADRKMFTCTPQRTHIPTPNTVDHGHIQTQKSSDCSSIQYNCEHEKTVEKSVFPRRMLAFSHQQFTSATPNSIKKDGSTWSNDIVGSNDVPKQKLHDFVLKNKDMGVDRLALLKMLQASPHLCTPARRVPLEQKQKKLSSNVSQNHAGKNMSKDNFSLKSGKSSSTPQTKMEKSGKTSYGRENNIAKAEMPKSDCAGELSAGDFEQHDGGKDAGQANHNFEVNCKGFQQDDTSKENAVQAKDENVDYANEMIRNSKQHETTEDSREKANQKSEDTGNADQLNHDFEGDSKDLKQEDPSKRNAGQAKDADENPADQENDNFDVDSKDLKQYDPGKGNANQAKDEEGDPADADADQTSHNFEVDTNSSKQDDPSKGSADQAKDGDWDNVDETTRNSKQSSREKTKLECQDGVPGMNISELNQMDGGTPADCVDSTISVKRKSEKKDVTHVNLKQELKMKQNKNTLCKGQSCSIDLKHCKEKKLNKMSYMEIPKSGQTRLQSTQKQAKSVDIVKNIKGQPGSHSTGSRQQINWSQRNTAVSRKSAKAKQQSDASVLHNSAQPAGSNKSS